MFRDQVLTIPSVLGLFSCLLGCAWAQTGSPFTLSGNDINSIVNRLNAIRSDVNPTATNMNILVSVFASYSNILM